MNIESELVQQVTGQLTASRKKWLMVLLAVFIVGVVLGAWAMHTWYVSDLREALAVANQKASSAEQLLYQERQKPPKIETKTETKTEFAYLPKETIIYKDAAGQTVTGKEKTDIDLMVATPTIFMKYNGQSYEMQGISGENSKFEQGKLTGEVSTAATIDVTDLVNHEVALQRQSDQKVLNAKLAEIKARQHRPQLDLISGAGSVGAGVRVDRLGLDYIRSDDDNRILLRYTILK